MGNPLWETLWEHGTMGPWDHAQRFRTERIQRTRQSQFKVSSLFPYSTFSNLLCHPEGWNDVIPTPQGRNAVGPLAQYFP